MRRRTNTPRANCLCHAVNHCPRASRRAVWLPWQPIADAIIMLTFTGELSAVHGGRTIPPLPKSANPAAVRGRAGEHDDYLLQMDFFFNSFFFPTFCDYPESIGAPAASLSMLQSPSTRSPSIDRSEVCGGGCPRSAGTFEPVTS